MKVGLSWKYGGQTILIDGHNRHKICEKHGIKFTTAFVEFPDRDHVKLWMEERAIGQRNMSDDVKSIMWNSIRERRSQIVERDAAIKREADKRDQKSGKTPSSDKTTESVLKAKKDTRKEVAKEAKLPERKLRTAQEIKKVEPKLSEMVRDSEITLVEAKKISVLPPPARKIAIAAVEDGKDVLDGYSGVKESFCSRKTAPAKH